jgi:uncharacterized lipoprotein NlpE involved in copper resistance
MIKKRGVICLLVLLILIGCNQISLEDKIVKILDKDSDFVEYTANHPDYTLSIEELNPDDVIIKKNTTKMEALYENLPDKTLYEVNIDDNGNGIVAIVDIEEKEVLKIFGLLMTSMGGIK